MIAYHWLLADFRSERGNEEPWKVGEKRTHKAKTLVLCERGYHSSPSPWDGLEYAPGPILCRVEIGEPAQSQPDKFVSRSRELLAAVNVSTELQQFALDCAERALGPQLHESRPRSWAAAEAAKFAADAAWAAAGMTRGAAFNAVWNADMARAAAGAAAEASARNAAWEAERDWQREHFNALMMPRLMVQS